LASKVNLDALIRREDFEIENVSNSRTGTDTTTIRLEDLKKDSFFFSAIRKPDFQRETNEWGPEKITKLVESYVTGDLIPAVILWQNGGFTFVIDGSHRLSALAAWVNDDYGDGAISKTFYDGVIPEDQIKIADRTRVTVRKIVGSYRDHLLAITDPDKVKSEIVERAKDLGRLAVQLQWVKGDARKAEDSFFKINQEASPIDKTELVLLKQRHKPNCMAARAIRRSGTGHKYWSAFKSDKQHEIEQIAKEINDMFFTPPLRTPIKTLDLPVAGKLYSSQTLPLILNFVNIVNDIDEKDTISISDDDDGEVTLQYLEKSKWIASRINSSNSGSLGLHPAVYLYSKDGMYKIASFYAVTALMLEFEKNSNLIKDFLSVRGDFEDILLEYDYFIPQIVRKYRFAIMSYKHLKDFYLYLIGELKKNISKEVIITELLKNSTYSYLNAQPGLVKDGDEPSKDFPEQVKSEVFMTEALATSLRCKICHGFIHKNSISIDHITRKADGGMGTLDNAQLTHPYCNTTYKQ
jgi:hypothetical protein